MEKISNFQSVFQLAVALNLAVTAFSSIRKNGESAILLRISELDRIIDLIIKSRTLDKEAKTKKADQALEKADAKLTIYREFKSKFFLNSKSHRIYDDELMIFMVVSACTSFYPLLYSSISPEAEMHVVTMVIVSILLYASLTVDIWRSITAHRKFNHDFRDQIASLSTSIKLMRNADRKRHPELFE
ncbi:hypothetical protein [Paramagnetospirillum magnetotacticum]|uniref:hypothetical protein n=1 Tax=Paramagnetospirillum magnetotacticum TaxID=188 RepID=UPI00126A2752|nr:hypothetical protein [Paramagnetospirillum magnetotacticum]